LRRLSRRQPGEPGDATFAPAQNTSIALRALLARWRDKQIDLIFTDGLETR